jgi:hypothetical protein
MYYDMLLVTKELKITAENAEIHVSSYFKIHIDKTVQKILKVCSIILKNACNVMSLIFRQTLKKCLFFDNI